MAALRRFRHQQGGLDLGGELSSLFIERGQNPRLPLSLPDPRAAREPPAAYATQTKALQQELLALLHAAQQKRRRRWTRAGPTGPSRRTTGRCCGLRSCSTPPRWASCARGGRGPFTTAAVAGPSTYALTLPRQSAAPQSASTGSNPATLAWPGTFPGPSQGPAGSPVVVQLPNRKILRAGAAAGPTVWYAGRAAPPPTIPGSRWNS